MLIDSHCHLASFDNKGDLSGALERAEEAGVSRLITIGTGTDDWDHYRKISAAHPGRIYYSVGLHPCDVDEEWADDLTRLPMHFADDPAPVALGEIGLDHFHLPKYPDEAAEVISRQEKAFRKQLSFALQFDCPIVIHSRECFKECFDIIDESGVDWSRVVFHCWAYGPEEMRLLNERGGRGSFTGIVTYKSAENVRQAALEQGLDRLMVETDAPYLAPVPKRGKPNEPAYVRHTAELLAELFGIPLEELAKVATRNTEEFFGLPRCG